MELTSTYNKMMRKLPRIYEGNKKFEAIDAEKPISVYRARLVDRLQSFGIKVLPSSWAR